MEPEITKKQDTLGCVGLLVVFAFIIFILNFITIDSGEVGIRIRNGRAVESLADGLHFQMPFIESVVKYDARTQKNQIDASSASRDLQDVKATVVFNYHINRDEVHSLYREVGEGYKETVIDPKLQESVKAATAKFTAEEIITRRTEVRETILKELKTRINERFFIIEDISIVNIEFSPEFSKAIEQKQLAEQSAKKATNDLERIKIEGDQKVTQAKSEAEARIQSAKGEAEARRLLQETMTTEMLTRMWIEKWNGVLPVVADGDGNILDIKSLIEKK